jgi:magnesium chelatase family protein
MAVRTKATTLIGIEAFPVEVEAQVSPGLRRFSIVGLPDGVLRESKERIRCAVNSSGVDFPEDDVVVSLAPASLPKVGAGVELAIALAILAAEGLIEPARLSKRLFLGELSLDGMLKPVPGAFAAACYAASVTEIDEIILPAPDAKAAAALSGVRVLGASSLAEVVAYIREEADIEVSSYADAKNLFSQHLTPDFSDVIGQQTAKRALEIAAAGNHNVLMIGPPGSGKSMLASRLASILPPLSIHEAIEVTKIQSSRLAGDRFSSICQRRPFRSPHHSISMAGLVGGGSPPAPGEISLAHRGVLFMDELAEFRRDVLESLRQPLENGKVAVSRAKYAAEFPAKFLLVAAMNPCPCGTRGDGTRRCRCSSAMLRRYFGRLSQPFLDRIDITLWVGALKADVLMQGTDEDPTQRMRDRVATAHKIRRQRLRSSKHSDAVIGEVKLQGLNATSQSMIQSAQDRFHLSNRGITRILKVARTIADIDCAAEIAETHIAEAISYRTNQFEN